MKRDKRIEYKGYTVVQSGYNYHVSVFDKSGKCVLHAQASREKTDEELRATVDTFLVLSKTVGVYLEKKGVDEHELH